MITMRPYIRCSLGLASLVMAFLPVHAEVGVDPTLRSYQSSPALTGLVTAAGDRDMESVMRRWVALFNLTHPGVEFRLSMESSATAPKALAGGTAQFTFVGRNMLETELALVVKSWGHEPMPIVVAGGTYDDAVKTHAEMIWVHPDNPIRGLTLAQLDAVYSQDRRRGGAAVTTWGDLGLTGEWAGQSIHPLRDKSVGGGQYFKNLVLQGGAWKQSVGFVPESGDVIAGVEKDKFAIGIAGRGFAKGAAVRALPIACTAAGPWVEPTRDNVASRDYPLFRVVYLYVNQTPTQPLAPLVKEFLRAILSREGQEAALADGHLPLTREQAAAELGRLN